MALLSVAEALARVTQGLEPLDSERVKLEQARGPVQVVVIDSVREPSEN